LVANSTQGGPTYGEFAHFQDFEDCQVELKKYTVEAAMESSNGFSRSRIAHILSSCGFHRKPIETAVSACSQPCAAFTQHNMRGMTPLHLTVEAMENAASETLVKAGHPCDVLDGDNRTPLHLAAMFGYKEIVETVLKHCKDSLPSLKTSASKPGGTKYGTKYTPYQLAVKMSFDDVARLLLDKGGSGQGEDSPVERLGGAGEHTVKRAPKRNGGWKQGAGKAGAITAEVDMERCDFET